MVSKQIITINSDEMDRPVAIAPRTFYKPMSARTPVLVILLLSTIALIVVTELACQRIPQHAGTGNLGFAAISNVINDTLRRDLDQNVEYREVVKIDITKFSSPFITPISPAPPESITPPPIPSTHNDDWLTLGGGSSTLSPPTTLFPIVPPKSRTHGQMPETHNDDWLTLGGGSTTPHPPTSTSSSLAQATPIDSSEPVPVYTPRPSTAWLAVGPGTPVSEAPVWSGSVTASLNFRSSSGYLIIEDGSTMVSSGSSIIGGQSTTSLTSPEAAYIPSGGASSGTRNTSMPTIGVFTVLSIGTTTDGTLTRVFTSAISTISSLPFNSVPATTLSSVRPTSTIVNGSGTFVVMPDGSTQIPPQISPQQYFFVTFLPILLAIIFAFPCRILDTTIREMEPFYQLGRPEGALAENSILLDYPTCFFLTTPFKAASRGHFCVLFSSTIGIAVLLLAPLSSEAFFVSLSSSCVLNNPHPELCHATWGVYPTLARTIEGILAFIAVLLILLIVLNARRWSGVYANPLSIAGLGSLYQDPSLQDEFRDIDGRVTNSLLRKILHGRRYGLSMTKCPDGNLTYGIAPAHVRSQTGEELPFIGDTRGKYGAADINEALLSPKLLKHRRQRYSGLIHRLLYTAVWLLLAGTFILVVYYRFTGGDTGFERFMESEKFGPRFMMTSVAVAIGLFWAEIDEDLRRTEPYRRLLSGNSHPKDSILVPTYMSPLSSFFSSLFCGHFLLAGVALVTILSDVLTIALANSLFSMTTVLTAFFVSTNIAIVILPLMLLVLGVLICRPSHDLHRLPRKPTTVASVLLYLTTDPRTHEGGMLDSLRGLSVCKEKERDDHVTGMGRLYGMGDTGGGQVRVDEEWRMSGTN